MVASRRALHVITIVMMVISMLGNSITTVSAAPNAQWNPNQYDFGPVTIGTTSTKTFTLKNNGPSTITLGSTAVTNFVAGPAGGPGTFTTQTNLCAAGNSLISGASCTVDVVFDPVTLGAPPDPLVTTGTLEIDVNDGGPNTTIVANLQGFGVTTGLTVTPGSLVFGNQLVGTTSLDQTITVKNTTAGPVNVQTIGSAPAPFFIQTDSCSGQTLAQNVSCTLTVTFKPTSAGPTSLIPPLFIKIDSTATPPTNNVALSGIGIDPVPTLNPSSLNFGTQPVNTFSPAQTIFLVNTTGQEVIVNGTPIVLPGSDFTVNSTTCANPITLPVGGSCSADIIFTPGPTPGPKLATVFFSTTAGGTLYNLSATVFGVATVGSLTISPGTVNFGSITVGQNSASQSVTITNLGGGDATITGAIVNANFNGGNAGNFDVIASACPVGPTPLAAGASCTVTLRFTPSASGNRSSALQVPTSSGTLQVTVNGVGVDVPVTAPILSVSPGALNFGAVQETTSSLGQVITIANTGTAPLTLISAGIVGGNSADFASIANTCSFPLAPGASCNVTLKFAPLLGAIGNRTSSYQIVTNAGTALVLLTGIGTAAPVTAPGISFSPAAVNFGNQQVGVLSGAQTVTVTNTGTANLVITAVALSGGDTGDFSPPSSSCGTLAPGAQCQINLTFTPTATGNRATSILVTDNVPSVGSTQIIPVNGVGVAAGVLIAPAVVNFGAVQQGQAAGAQNVTITNTGLSNITITGAINSGNITPAAGFSVIASGCPVGPTALAPGASCTVSLGFTPGVVGNSNAALQVTTSAGLVQATLTGAGTSAPVTNPFASLSAGTLSFGNQTVNTQSAAQAVTITNVGTANLVFSAAPNISNGDASQFQIVTDGCGTTTLIPGASCTVTVRFFPGTLGQKSSTLIFTSNISGTYSIVNLTGNSVAAAPTVPAISFTPAAVAFGPQQLLTLSGAQTITVTNTGTAPLTVTSIVPAGGNTGDFAVAGQDCTTLSPLAPGSSCVVGVTFTPNGLGNRASALLFSDNAPVALSTQIVPLSGSGVAAGTPAATVTPTSINFGTVQVGLVGGAVPVMLTNTGTANLTLSAIPVIAGAESAHFGIVTDGCGTSTLAPGASCTVTVRFEPDAPAATRSATLNFATNASGSPHLVNLTGVGSAVPVVAPFAVVSPPSIDFGSVQQGTLSGAQAVTITNTGTANLVFGGGTPIALSSATNFSIVTNGCPGAAGTLAPNASCTVVVRFSPAAASLGNLTATLSFADNSAGGSPQLVVLNGNATAAPVLAPQISFAPASVNFGNQQQAVTSGVQTIVVTNVGNDNLFISAILPPSIQGGNSGDFALTHTCPTGILPLQPGAQCTVSVTFTPTALGQRSSAVRFVDNNNGVLLSTQFLPLEGLGVPAGVAIAPASIDFGSIQQGLLSGAQAVTVTNTGLSPITLTGPINTANNIVGGNTADFVVVNSACPVSPATLAPGVSCTVTVRFTPGALVTGNRASTFQVVTTAGTVQTILNGFASPTPVTAPFASLSAATLSFGNQVVSTPSAAQAVTITNTGTADLVFSAAPSIGGPDAAMFSPLVSDGCGTTTLTPGASCTVTVRFTPTSVGQKSAALVFTSNISGLYSIVNLTGNGVAAGVPAITLSPTVVNFGNVPVGTSAVQVVTATNSGTGPLVFGTVVVANAGFSESGDTCQGVTLAPGQSCQVAVIFAPGTATALPGTLTFNDNAPTGGSSQVVNLSGTGTSPLLTFAPAPLDFGNVAVGTTSTRGIAVTNVGGQAAALTTVNGLGGDFTQVSTTCAAITLAVGASCVVVVQYAPSSVGLDTDTVDVGVSGFGTFSSAVVGNGVAAPTPALTISPAVLNFGNVAVQTAVAETVTITNSGNAPLVISGFTNSSTPFTVSGNGCTNAVTLQPGQSCSFAVTFAPTTTGSQTDTVSLASNVPGSPHTINLRGFGVSSVLAFTPPPVNFGNVTIGSGSTLGLLVTNLGGGPITISAVGGLAAPFTIEGDTCTGLTLAPNASCVLDIKFQPTAAGYVFDSVTVTTGAGTYSAVVDGTGVVAPTPAITITPGAIAFGNVPVGTTVSQVVTVKNTGGAAFTVNTVSGLAAPLAITGNGCNATVLNPNGTCTFTVTFAPTTTGPASGTVSIASTLSGSPHLVGVSGTGVSSVLSFTPSPLNFGSIAVGTTSTLGVLVTNTGVGPVAITAAGGLGGDFTLVSTTCVTTLAPGASCAVVVSYTPSGVGADSDAIDLTVTGVGTVSSAVVGNGVPAPTPALSLSPAVLNFGNVGVGASASQTVTVSNTGGAAFTLGSPAISGAGAPFTISGNGCNGVTLNPGQSCTFAVTFAPTATGPAIVALSIASNAPGNPHVLNASGTGVSNVLSITPSPLHFGNVAVGTSATLGALVTNTGGGPVAILSVTEQTVGAPITIVSTTCTAITLAPGDSCVVNVQFTPTAAGNFTDQLQINGPGPVLLATSSVVGVGVTAPVPTVSIQPTSLDFGDVQVNTTSPALPLTVTNTGNAPLNITTLGTSNAVYALSANGCAGATLQPGQSCTVGVTFAPTAVAQTVATLQINDNAGGVATFQLVSLTGNGISAGLSVTPGSIDFGNQQLNTASAVQTVTVKNVGLSTLTINAAVASAGFATFADTCTGQTLAAGVSCTIGVRFTPTATGQATGTLTFTTTGPDPIVSLLGVGISAQLSVTPSSLDFGNQQVSVPSAAQTVTVKNIGVGPVTLTNTVLNGTNAGDFDLVGNTCQPNGADVTLASGAQCVIGVRFIPTTTGARNALLVIESNAPGSGNTVSVGLTGFGVTSGPTIGFNPSSLDFGSIPVNTSATKTLTVTNTGTAPLIFTASGVVLSGSAYYTVTGNGCTDATLLPGESCTVGVTFAPTTTGVANGLLTFNSNAPATPHTVNVTGIGTSAVFTFDPLALNFGQVQVNTTATLSVLVTNRTGGPASITGLSGVAAPFTLIGNSCSGILLPDGASCALTFTFAPTVVGYASNTVTLSLSTGGTITLALTGTGVPQPTPLLSITPASLDFGYIQVGQTTPARTVTVKNVGTVDVTMTSAVVAGAGFAEATDTCQGQVLQPGQSCTVSVTFTPASAAALSGTLTFTDSAPSSTQVVPLFGNGITAGLSIAPASLNFGNVQVGTTSAAQVVTVTNTGGGPVNITNFGLVGADIAHYEVVDNTCITSGFPATLAPGASCTFGVRFKPTTPGAKPNAVLSITDTAAGNPQTVGLNGVGVTPAFNLSANGLDFGNIVVGQTSPTQTVTLTNSTNGPLSIVSVVSSAPAVYLVTGDTCSGQTIPAGATCQIGVQFRPAAVGVNNQTLTITYNNGQGGNATVAVQLTGNGISGALGVSPNALNFGYQQVGTTSAAKVVTITGNPSGSVQIISAVVQNGTHFAETGDTCQGQTLAPNGTCTVGVTFTPTTPGQKNDILRITYNAGSGNQTVDIALAGIGVSPVLILSANGLDFGAQQVNTTSPVQTVTVTNSTNGPLTLGNPSIPGGSPFLESGDTCNGLTLAPGQSCTIGVQFRPGTTGPLLDTLTIPYDNGQAITVNVGVNLTGIGITAQVSVTPASLDFGNLQLGSTSPAQTVTVKNVGAGPVNITGTTIAGQFSIVANTCFTAGNGATLPAGASCTVGVVFQPTTPAGNKTGTLTIADSASGTPHVVSLTGVGVTPAISVTPASLLFGPQQIGIDSPAQVVTVKNIGIGPVTVGAITAAANPPFRIVDNQCAGLTLAVNQTCTFAVVFNSASAGTFNGTVSITTDSPVAATVTTVTLVGTATNASLYVNTPTVDFGTVQVGTTAGPKTITLTNVGSGPILIGSGPTLGGPNAGNFALSTGCTGATLFPLQSCTIEVTFTPSTVGPRDATITVTDNASGSPQTIALTGVGINPGFTLSASGLDFGYQQVGTFSAPKTVRLTNNTTGPLTISTVALANGGHFQITGENCSARTLGPGQFCEIGVVFKPTTVGQKNDILQVVYNNGVSNVTLGVTLTGIGVSPTFNLSAQGLNFGYVQVNQTSPTQTITLTNSTGGPLTLGTIAVTQPTIFQITADTCSGKTIQAGATCQIGVAFRPNAASTFNDTLTIPYQDGQGNTVNIGVTLTGNGITPHVSVTPASLDFGNVQVGTTSAAQTVTVKNIGSGPVTITAAGITAGGTDFTIVANTCFTAGNGAVLPPDATCTIGVVFNPISPAGAKTGTLTIGDSASGTPQTVSLTGVGITANLSITPASLDFGNRQVGTTSPAQTVTIKNIGAGPTTITAASITAGGADFTVVGNTCFSAGNGATLPVNGTCTVSVVFNPVTPGAKTGTLTIADTASGTPQTVSLTGVGITPNLSIVPAALDFGYQQVGTTSASQTITVTNIGSGPVTIANVVKSGGAMGAQFDIVGNTCFSAGNGATLPPGATCTITVTFSPASVGLKQATITITDNASGTPQVVALQGTGITAQLSIVPGSLDFGIYQVGSTSAAQTVTVTNVGSGPLTISNTVLAGTDPSQFEIVANTCFSTGNGATLPPGATCTIGVRFHPTSVGNKSALLNITDSASGTTQSVGLTGIGVTQALTVTPASLSFGPQQININTPAQTVTVKNTTNGPVAIGAIIAGPNPPFSIVTNTCSGNTLAPNATCTFSVVFNSATAGTFNGVATITSDTPLPGTLTTVSLVGVATNPSMEITPASLDFGNQQTTTTSAAQTVTIRNNGYGPLTINNLTLTGPDQADYQIVDDGCAGQVLPAGQTCTVGVRFRPGTPGAKTAQLRVTSDAATSPQTVGLSGVGITPGLTFLPVAINFGNQQLNTTATQSILVQNSTGGPVTISNVVVGGSPAFSLTGNTCLGATLPAGGFCVVGVNFRPTTLGAHIGQVTFTDTAAGSPHIVTLSGQGLGAPTPVVGISAPSLDFGNQQVGTTSPAKTVTITNNGDAALVITSAVITTGGANFTKLADTCSGQTINPGLSCTISVVFNPTTTGPLGGVLTLTDNAPSGGSTQTISLTGVGITAQVSVTPASLDFGNIQSGAVSAAQVVTVTNVGAGPVNLTATTLGGADASQFELLDNTCFSAGNGATLPSGASCTVAVRFKPSATGAKSATLSIATSASGTPQVVGLSGTGLSAALGLNSASLDFGNQQVGTTSAAKTVSLTNTSNGPLTITGVTSSSGEFQVVGNTCGSQTIAPNATCTISVIFAPVSTGAKAATLTITDSTNTGSHLVSLTGVGVTPALNVSPASLDFGNQATNTTSPAKTVTVTNIGTGPVDLTAFGLVGADSGQFAIVANNCLGATLPTNGTCTIGVIFQPTSAGAKNATLTITNSATGTPQTVSLTGNGITGALSFQPVAVNFGSQQINTTATQAIVVTNTSGSPVSFSAVALGGGSSPAFSLTGNTCLGATLPAGGSCTVGVNFTPATIGQHFGTVAFTDTAAGSPHVVTLSGQGTGTPTPVIGINPPSLDFGNQQVGTTSAARTVTITNTGPAALVISSAAITVGGADFTKIADTCSGQTVNPGESCTVSVVFNPSVNGPRAGLLTLTDNVPNANSVQTISLTGVGVTGALTVTPSALDFGSQQVGTTSTVQTLTVRNTGAANLTINALTVGGSDFVITGANCVGVTLVPGATCQIGIVFKPTTIGVRNATLTISHDGPGSPTTVSLTGVGLSAAIGISVGSLDFGPQQVNTSSPAQTATITNKSNGPLQISTIVSDNPEFQVFANTCASLTLAPNATCTVSVVFRPSQTGQRTATLTINDSTATGSHTISLTGLAVSSAVTLSAANFQFGSIQVGSTSPAQTLTVRNSGENALSITAVLISGPNSSDFIKSGDTCLGATLAPGQECQVSVSFSPSAGGNRSATLQINDTAPGSPRTVVLGGIGITPVVTFSPLSLDFGQVAVGATSAAQTVTLINTSDGPLTISSVTTSNAAFKKGADTCILATLPAGGSCQVSLTFQPTAVGQASGNLVFNTTVGSGQQSISLTGLGVTAATPTLGLSTTTLSFGAQQVGSQSVTQVLTLTNTGNVPVSVSSVVLNGTNPGDFVLYGNSCVGATLAVNGTCQIGVAFKPTGTGNRNSTLRIEDTAAGSPRLVALLGIGIAPTLSVSVPSLEFGAIQVGATSAPQTVTLTNTSSSSVALTNVLINGANPNDFVKTLDTCVSATLAPAASCSVTVRFTPQAGGTRSGGLLILIGSGSPLTIGLNGLGVTAQASFDPATLNFGTQPVTTMSNFQTVRLTNGGSGVLTITAVSLFGGDIGDFVVAGDTCSGGTLGPSGSCQVNVAFRPTTTGNRFANLAFSTNVGTGTQTVALQGVGATTPTPAIQLSTQGMTFGPQQVGTQSAIQSITVTNSGTANLVISNTSIVGQNIVDFARTGDNCAGVTLAPGASCSLGIRFAPTVAGNRLATLLFTTNAGTGSQSVSLVGLGITSTVHLSATSLQFGQQTVNLSSAGQMLQITNTGNGPLVIQSVTIIGVNTSDFIKNGDTCAGATIAPGLACTVGVIFRPLSVGNKSASLLVNDNAPGAPREIALTGEGTQGLTPSVGLSASSFNFGSVQVGSISTGQSLIVTNTGAAPLHITALVINGVNSGDFAKSGDTCANATIAPQSFCSVGLLFRPTASGVRVGTLFMVDDTAGSPREINLTGVGITGAVGLSAASLDFGGQTVGIQSATQNFTVTNTGQGALTLGSVAVVGANAGDWVLLANTCVNATVPTGATCQVGIAFKPTAEGDRSATLAVTNTAAGSVHSVALLGTGLPVKPSYTVTLTLSSFGCNGSILPAGGVYVAGTLVTLQVTPTADYLFLGWRVNEIGAGWANPLDLTVTRDTRVEANCVPKIAFTDTQNNPYLQAIYELTARGIIRGYTSDGCVQRNKTAPCFGPDDTTLRAQMAALIARAMGWDLENHGNGFNDGAGIDANLWRNVGTLAYYGVAFGYGDGNFGPNDQVTQAQTISFITRAMVVKGYWQRQPDNAALYPDVPASSGHRIDIATYVHYVGAVPGTSSPNGAFAWSAPATRAWFSQTLWLALNSYFGRDVDGRGGFVP